MPKIIKINIKKRFIYIFTAILTKSSLLIIIPFFYIFKAIKTRKQLIYTVVASFTFSLIAIFTNSFSLYVKLDLLFKGGALATVWGGRYLANYLIIQNIINPTSLNSLLLGNGSGSYHRILEDYLQNLNIFSDSFLANRPYDHGGSDILIFINDFGFIGFLVLISLLFYLIKERNKIMRVNQIDYTLLGSRISCLLLTIKGLGVYSPFTLLLLILSIV